jgi:hypothetical protein
LHENSISEIEKFAQLVTGNNIARVGVIVAFQDVCRHFVSEGDMGIPDALQLWQKGCKIGLKGGFSLENEIQQIDVSRMARVQILQYCAITGHLLVCLYLSVQFLYSGVEEQKVIDSFIEKKIRREIEHQTFVNDVDRTCEMVYIVLKYYFLQHNGFLPLSAYSTYRQQCCQP